MKIKIMILLVLSAFIFSKSFKVKDDNNSLEIRFSGEDVIATQNLVDNIIPITSTFYQISKDSNINVEYSINDISYEQNINLDINFLNEETGFNSNDNGVFPKENIIISEPMIFRGIPVVQISFIPFSYNSITKELQIYNNINFDIEEIEQSIEFDYTDVKLSRAFEPLFEDLIVNYEISNREEDYQMPSILYICGGSSIDHPYVEELLEWRHKIGYIVTAVSTNQTGSSSSQIKSYIENAYETWENPPEIVGLIGDTGGSYSIGYFTESLSGYGGAGDFPYSQLDGNDLLPEVFIGRISVNSSSDLSNVLNKTLAYEKATYINQTGTSWYETAALCGDPSSSGWSTVITNEYVENILDVYGFEDINTNFGSGNYDNWMENELEDGNLYMNYRGYYGSSGFGSGEINGANNGYMTPFASFITCGTGDFNGTSLSEDFIRAGSVSNPKGAVAAVGTSTTGTHTFFNNIMSMGIYDGIFPKDLRTAGASVANGRLSLYWTYPSDPSNRVTIFSHWLNLMGDPGLHFWTDTPEEINVSLDNAITWGTNFIDIIVNDLNGNGVDNAKVTILKGDDEIFASYFTNSQGSITIPLQYESTGEVFVTVTKKNCIPVEESFQIINSDVNINLSSQNISISDVIEGNEDGYLNPGEIANISLPLINYGSTTVGDVQAILTSESNLVNIIYGINQYENIAPGEIAFQTGNYIIELSENAVYGDDLELKLNISDFFGNSWQSVVPIQVYGGLIVVDHIQYINNFELNPGEEGDISIYLVNNGNTPMENIELNLLPSGSLIEIIESTTTFPTIQPGQIVESDSYVKVFVNGNTINGSVLSLNANISNSIGYNQDEAFNIQVGHVSVTDPLGPDEHGYYIYDSNDLGYNLSPIYDWIEIDNDYGGDGINLNLSDSGDGNNISNNSSIIDLPFEFTFYGITYDRITVNTNGWISFGESSLESFRNYPIPGAGGPSPMLAVFWDDLKTTGGGEVYKYIGENFVIIEWSEMKTYNNNSSETFQAILFDDTNLTPTGDNEILLQYKDFNNTSSGSYGGWSLVHGCYSTIGVENHLSTVALQYTFNNEYPTAAMPLSDNTALFITTRNPIETLLGDSNQDGEVNVIDVVVIVNHIINLELLDPMGVYISDMDGNGNINILDVIQIINAILG